MLEKLPFQNQLLKHIQVTDASKRTSCTFQNVVYLVEIFPALLELNPAMITLDSLEDEFLSYQSHIFPEGILIEQEPDTAWHQIGSIKGVTGQLMFQI